LLENTQAAGHTKTDGFAFTLALTALVRANTDTQGYCPKKARSVTVVVAANVNPLPAIVGRDLSPAGVVRVIVEATTKAERDEIAIVEPMVEMIMVVVPVVGPVSSSPHWPVDRCPVENWPISHRAGAVKSTHSAWARAHCAWSWSSDWPVSRAHRAAGASSATHTGMTTTAHSAASATASTGPFCHGG